MVLTVRAMLAKERVRRRRDAIDRRKIEAFSSADGKRLQQRPSKVMPRERTSVRGRSGSAKTSAYRFLGGDIRGKINDNEYGREEKATGMMQFDEFVSALAGVLRATPGAAYAKSERTISWSARAREATVTLVPPLNISLTLRDAGGAPVTNWYPIDAALVPVVSQRVAGFLSEA